MFIAKFTNFFKTKKSDKHFFSSKKITYIAMLATVTTCVITLLSSYVPLMILPSIRLSFEGILVKLSGYLFGPFIGILVGIMTELLVNLIRPSFLHWAYTLLIVSFGLFGGCSYLIRNKTKNPVQVCSFAISVLTVLFMFAIILLIYLKNESTIDIFNIKIDKWLPVWVMSIFFIVVNLGVWVATYLYNKNKYKWIINILPIIFLCFLTEIPTILLSPLGDAHSLNGNSQGYNVWVTFKLVELPFRIFINIMVIYTSWVVLSKIILRNQKRNKNGEKF